MVGICACGRYGGVVLGNGVLAWNRRLNCIKVLLHINCSRVKSERVGSLKRPPGAPTRVGGHIPASLSLVAVILTAGIADGILVMICLMEEGVALVAPVIIHDHLFLCVATDFVD